MNEWRTMSLLKPLVGTLEQLGSILTAALGTRTSELSCGTKGCKAEMGFLQLVNPFCASDIFEQFPDMMTNNQKVRINGKQ